MGTAVLVLAAALAAAPPSKAKPGKLDCGTMACSLHATAGDALEAVLKTEPQILAIGEVHQTHGTVEVRSAISRFTADMLPRLRRKASDLIVETWIAEGNCGEAEEESVEQIEETTQRPETTEDEVVTLILKARELFILPHILELSCDEYAKILDGAGELDPEKLLQMVTRLLEEKVKERFERNRMRKSKRIVVVYGGAIHNDAEPPEDSATFAFGRELAAAGRYAELDLYVPELIAGDEDYANEPWFPYFERYASKSKTLLIRQRTGAFIIIFPKGVKPPRARK